MQKKDTPSSKRPAGTNNSKSKKKSGARPLQSLSPEQRGEGDKENCDGHMHSTCASTIASRAAMGSEMPSAPPESRSGRKRVRVQLLDL